jgi:hypothetical protein
MVTVIGTGTREPLAEAVERRAAVLIVVETIIVIFAALPAGLVFLAEAENLANLRLRARLRSRTRFARVIRTRVPAPHDPGWPGKTALLGHGATVLRAPGRRRLGVRKRRRLWQ